MTQNLKNTSYEFANLPNQPDDTEMEMSENPQRGLMRNQISSSESSLNYRSRPKWQRYLIWCLKVSLFLSVLFLEAFLIWYFYIRKEEEVIQWIPRELPTDWRFKLRTHIYSELPTIYEEIPLPEHKSLNPNISLVGQTYISYVCLSVLVHDPDHLNIILRDCNNTRWELPFEDPYAYPKDTQYLTLENSNFDFSFTKSPLRFEVKRKETQETIFKWTQDFVFTDNYLEFSFETPTNEIYGLGERSFTLQFFPGTYSLFIMDRTGDIERGTPGHNTQGHHPVYLMKEKSNKYHMNLLRNINSGEFTLGMDNSTNTANITWQLIGGVVDFNFFLGDENPETVVKAYHRYIGGWSLPAFWAMGYQQHKWWGYKNISQLTALMRNYSDANLALDTVFSDIEFLDGNVNFKVDAGNFSHDAVIALYEEYNMKSVCVVQAFLPADETNPAYSFPNVRDLALQEPTGEPFLGGSFGGPAYVIDYTHPRAEEFWREMLRILETKWPFTGLWLDANEITIFISDKFPDRANRKYGALPFYPGKSHLYGEMFMAPPDCIHADGTEEFDVRGVPGLLQCKYTHDYLRDKHPFPFVLSRSTLFGSGKYALHWLADYGSTWDHMRCSIGTLSTFNIFGIPFVGTDVCGFLGHTRVDPQLCARWYQLGSFYPYTKNGHAPTNQWYNSQEPFTFDGIIFDTISAAINLRYSLLKYFYTLFFLAEGRELKIGTVFRPLFFEFYNDSSLPPYGSTTHEDQFLLGTSLMAAPVLKANVSEIDVYFPDSRWYDLRNFKEVNARGKSIVVDAKLPDLPPYYLRGGGIFFQQETEKVRRTEDLDNRFIVAVGLDDFNNKKSQANGFLLGVNSYDEHKVFDGCVNRNCILNITVECEIKDQGISVGLKISHGNSKAAKVLEPSELVAFKIYLMGLPSADVSKISSLKMQGQSLQMKKEGDTIIIDFERDSELKLIAGADYQFISS